MKKKMWYWRVQAENQKHINNIRYYQQKSLFSRVFVSSLSQNTFDYSSGNNACYRYIKFKFLN